MEVSFRSLDPSERENAQQYVRAVADAQNTEEGATSSTKDSKKIRRRNGEKSEMYMVCVMEEHT